MGLQARNGDLPGRLDGDAGAIHPRVGPCRDIPGQRLDPEPDRARGRDGAAADVLCAMLCHQSPCPG
jgi:hypothetical protein